MTTRPRRSGSKGIRLYYHFNKSATSWDRTRESHNYDAGLKAVHSLMGDPTVVVTGVGCESGAMCLHYERNWS